MVQEKNFLYRELGHGTSQIGRPQAWVKECIKIISSSLRIPLVHFILIRISYSHTFEAKTLKIDWLWKKYDLKQLYITPYNWIWY